MTGTVTYVYAAGRDVRLATVAALRGVDDAPVRLVTAGDVQAVVSDAARSAVEGLAPAERAEDLQRLADIARAHHRVVDVVGRDHVIAPFSLATAYYDDDRVRAVLTAGRDSIATILERLRGRSEWGVKAWARPAPEPADPADRPRSGAAYLRRRRDALREGEATLEQATASADALHEALTAVADDARRHPPQDAALSGIADPMVLNGAYLVPEAAGDRIAELVAARHDPLVRVEITGPWVPYSFATMDRS